MVPMLAGPLASGEVDVLVDPDGLPDPGLGVGLAFGLLPLGPDRRIGRLRASD
jgi:hypothetical protein